MGSPPARKASRWVQPIAPHAVEFAPADRASLVEDAVFSLQTAGVPTKSAYVPGEHVMAPVRSAVCQLPSDAGAVLDAIRVLLRAEPFGFNLVVPR